MKLHELSPKGTSRKKRRLGRGIGTGRGKTSGRGHKGQNARSGGKTVRGFEGGQMPLQRRVPKRGFHNIFRKEYSIVNVGDLNRFEPETTIDSVALRRAGLVKSRKEGIKLLGRGEISHPLILRVDKASSSARAKIESAGGRVETL